MISKWPQVHCGLSKVDGFFGVPNKYIISPADLNAKDLAPTGNKWHMTPKKVELKILGENYHMLNKLYFVEM